MKAIQITIDDKLLSAMDRALKGKTRRRSAFIRYSISNELKRIGRKQLESLDRKGYEKHPVAPGEFDVAATALSWGDPWNPQGARQERKSKQR